MTTYGTIPDVELLTAGMDWPASTGPSSITLEHIADMVVAGNDDPHIQPARVKLGHTSSLNDGIPHWNPFAPIGDAEPAFGRVANLRTANDGAVLLGDLIEVPDWLVQAAPSAFPNRSAEIVWSITTDGGKRYTAVLTGIALLGTFLPAVSDLEDLQRLLAAGPEQTEPTAATTARGGPMPDALSVSITDIRDRFNWEWAMSGPIDGLNTTFWWARDIRVDPDEVIADDDEGHLWSVPFTTDGEDNVTFGDPIRVRETFVPVTAEPTAATAAFAARVEQRTVATGLSRPDKQHSTTTAASRPEPEEQNPMDDSVRQALARQHGLDPDTATEDEINAAVLSAATTPPEPVGDEVTLTRAQFEELQRGAEAGVAAQAELTRRTQAEEQAEQQAQSARERDEFLQTAVDDGRLHPVEDLPIYRDAFDRNPEGTRARVEALQPGVVPALERVTPDPRATAATAAIPGVKDDEPLPDGLSLLTPAERAAKRSS